MVRRGIFVLLAAVALCAPVANADTLIVEGLDNSKTTVSDRPNRGVSMENVEATFGQPESRQSPIGDPPITRWEYSNFVVYFEFQNVIHAVQKH